MSERAQLLIAIQNARNEGFTGFADALTELFAKTYGVSK